MNNQMMNDQMMNDQMMNDQMMMNGGQFSQNNSMLTDSQIGKKLAYGNNNGKKKKKKGFWESLFG